MQNASKSDASSAAPGVYELLVQNIVDFAIYMLDADGMVCNWNAGAQRAKGYAADEIIGRHFSCFYTEEDRAAGLPMSGLSTARTAGRFETEGWRVRKDGSRFWAHVVIQPIRGEGEVLLGFAKITRDRTQWRQQQQRAIEHERRFRLLVEGVTDYAIYMLEPDGTVSNWNAGAQRAKGYTASEIVGKHFSCFYDPEDRAAGHPENGLASALRDGKYEAEGWRLRKDGTRFWASVLIQPIRDENGTFFGFTKITRDCTAQRENSLSLLEARRNLDLALANMLQGLCLFDADGALVLVNARFAELLELDAAVLAPPVRAWNIMRAVMHRAGPSSQAKLRALRRHLVGGLQEAGAVRNGELAHLDRILALSNCRLAHGGWLLTVEDVTTRRRSEQRIEYLARHDTLTGLPNRFDFQERLRRLLASSGPKSRFALLYLDLDRFKSVNDSLGHHCGDQLLKLVAGRLTGVLRGDGQLSRLGGDEFTILLPRCGVEEAKAVAQRCIAELTRSFDLSGHEVRIGVSIGIVVQMDARLSVDDAMLHADQAMYQAKREGRNCHCVFDPGLNDPLRRHAGLEGDLRDALDNEQLRLYYQPIFDAGTGETRAFEALLRWTHPSRGEIPPEDVIPLAEEADLMCALGAWVLRRACTDALDWPAHMRLAVNVSPAQLQTEDFSALLEDVVKSTGLASGRLELEITEAALIGPSEMPGRVLRRARAMGVGVALDDFGVGYSSLRLLQNFPFTRIKIDRSLVHGIGESPKSMAMLRAMLALCRNLGMPVIAEGVETEEERQMLCEAQCTELQGFLFQPALPAAELRGWLDHGAAAVMRRLAGGGA